MEKRKLVIISVTNDLSYDQRMRRHATILANGGYKVALVGRNKPQSIALENEIFEQYRLNCIWDKGLLFYIEFNLRLFFFLLKHPANINVAVDLDTLLANTLASVFNCSKLVFDSHEYFTEVPELIDRPVKKGIWDYLAKTCIPYTHQRYTVGEALALELSEVYGKPFDVIMNVPNFNESEFSVEKQDKHIVYQGALNKGRGLEALILAMHQIDCKLLIIGEGDLSEQLRHLVQTEKLNEKIQFAGWIKPNDLLAYTQKAWLGYNLLEAESKSYYFSLANKFFDYMHAGVPQLCSPFPEYQSINNKFEVAILCHCNSAEIVEAISHLLNHENLYKKLQNNCRMAAKAYNLQIESEKLTQIFELI